MKQRAHRSQLIAAIKEKFPELREAINQERGLLTYEMKVFMQFVQTQIDLGQQLKVSEAYQLLSEYYLNGNKALANVIRNAIAEDLVLADTKKVNRAWAFHALPEPLKAERRAWFTFMEYPSE